MRSVKYSSSRLSRKYERTKVARAGSVSVVSPDSLPLRVTTPQE